MAASKSCGNRGTKNILLLSIYITMILAQLPSPVNTGKVLLFPFGHGYSSRLGDMLKMTSLLQQNGHYVGFITNTIDIVHLKSVQDTTFHTFPPPMDRKTVMDDEEFKASLMANTSTSQDQYVALELILKNFIFSCEALIKHGLLDELKAAQYDLFIVDAVDNCGRVITQYLSIPTMTYSSTGFVFDQAAFPNLPSVIPVTMISSTADMPFFTRVLNSIMCVGLEMFMAPSFYDAFVELQKKYGLFNASQLHFRKSYVDQVNLVHADFALEPPRPLLPNVVLIGGMFVPEAKPLNQDLEDFMFGAGKDGVVLVSFGTLIKAMDPWKARAIAISLAKLPQRVVWRYFGTPPDGLGSNTRLLKWLPQNDLLAHPQTRLFISHCGVHSTYEMAWHAVPVIAIPLMFDQFGNAGKLVGQGGMGIQLDFRALSESVLDKAIHEVLHNPKFKQNALETSQMLRDHPQRKEQLFMFWVEKLLRDKGIGKLVLEPLKHMWTFQLYCCDVILFLCVIVILVLLVLCYLTKCFCRCLCKRKVSAKKHKTS